MTISPGQVDSGSVSPSGVENVTPRVVTLAGCLPAAPATSSCCTVTHRRQSYSHSRAAERAIRLLGTIARNPSQSVVPQITTWPLPGREWIRPGHDSPPFQTRTLSPTCIFADTILLAFILRCCWQLNKALTSPSGMTISRPESLQSPNSTASHATELLSVILQRIRTWPSEDQYSASPKQDNQF